MKDEIQVSWSKARPESMRLRTKLMDLFLNPL
jgi:hypothetical protein